MTDWLHIGARAAALNQPSDHPTDCDETPTPYELGQFRTGYQIGRVNGSLFSIRGMMKWLNRKQIAQMADELAALTAKYEHEFFGEENKPT